MLLSSSVGVAGMVLVLGGSWLSIGLPRKNWTCWMPDWLSKPMAWMVIGAPLTACLGAWMIWTLLGAELTSVMFRVSTRISAPLLSRRRARTTRGPRIRLVSSVTVQSRISA